MKLENNIHDIAIDFHDISYYGDKNNSGIRGIKLKNGSSWGKSFCTLDIIGTSHLTLDVIDINSLNKNYSLFIDFNYNNITCLKLKFKNLIANAIKLLNGSLFFEKCK